MEEIELKQYTLLSSHVDVEGKEYNRGDMISLTDAKALKMSGKLRVVGGNIPADYGAKNDEIAGLLIKVGELTTQNETLQEATGELEDTIKRQGQTISDMLKANADAAKAAKADAAKAAKAAEAEEKSVEAAEKVK